MSKNIHSLTAIAALAALGLSGAAFSADNRGVVPGVDVDSSTNIDANVKAPLADKNSDGKITKAEAASNKELSKQFSALDANKDGNLDMTEYAKFEATGEAKASAKSKTGDAGDEAPQTTNVPGTTDDSTPGNQDKLGPGR